MILRTWFAMAAGLLAGMPILAEPIFPNSIVSNDIDFIRANDAHAFACLVPSGVARREMPDPRVETLLVDGVATYRADFDDGTQIEIWVHPDVPDPARRAEQLGRPLGRLATSMRLLLNHVVILDGDLPAFGEDRGRFFVVFSGNVDVRIANDDLDETVFHEAVHATLDVPHATSFAWQEAVAADDDWITEYARDNPQEDMAESALFAVTLQHHPARLPDDVAAQVREIMPARLAFFENLLGRRPWTFGAGPPPGC